MSGSEDAIQFGDVYRANLGELDADGAAVGGEIDQPGGVSFSAGGVAIGTATLKKPDEQFELQFTVPSELVGSSTMEIEIEVSRPIQVAGDTRSLGLTFGTFTLQ